MTMRCNICRAGVTSSGCAASYKRSLLVGGKGPGHTARIEPRFDRGLDHLETRRGVEVSRNEQAVVAHVQDFVNASGAQRTAAATGARSTQTR
jgi:hypothetical protein